MIELVKLNLKQYKGKEFTVHYTTESYLDIVPFPQGFKIEKKLFSQPATMSFKDSFFSEWLENPVGYGVFENGQLIAYAEGSIESWNNRYRISNICIFNESARRKGIGTQLINKLFEEAKTSGARMIVLETQTCNEKAISFYQKHGFEMIGFDLYSYSNIDPKRHEIRIEMGKQI